MTSSQDFRIGLGREYVSLLLTAPFLLCVAQSPAALLDLIQKFLEVHFMQAPLLGFSLFFPIYCIASMMSSALTFALVLGWKRKEPRPLSWAIRLFFSKIWQLILASFLVESLFVLGLCAMVIPGLYFMVVYLFVPQIILSEPHTTISLALFRSKKVVKSSIAGCVATLAAVLLISLLSHPVNSALDALVPSLTTTPGIRVVLSNVIDLATSLVSGALVDVWISLYYLNLRARKDETDLGST